MGDYFSKSQVKKKIMKREIERDVNHSLSVL